MTAKGSLPPRELSQIFGVKPVEESIKPHEKEPKGEDTK